MRWLMDHGHTAPAVDAKSKEVEDVLAFYRRHNDLVMPSGNCTGDLRAPILIDELY